MATGLFGTNVAPGRIRPAAIQPTGTPGSTYVRPQQRETGGNLNRLADALSGLNSALQGYAQVREQQGRDPNSDENRAFVDSISTMGMKEAMERYPQAANRVQKDAVVSLVGDKAAAEFRRHITEKYNDGSFDQANGDFNAWVEQERQKFAQGLPEQSMQAAFYRGTEQWMQQFSEQDLKRKVENTMIARDTAVVDKFRNAVDDGITAGHSAQEIVDSVIGLSRETREFMGLDGKSQNATLFSLAEELALNGKPELARALLEHDRGGIGPLKNVSEYTDKSIKLLAAADARKAEIQEANSFRVRTGLDIMASKGELTIDHMEQLAAEGNNTWLTPAMMAQYVETSKRNKAEMLEKEAKEQAKRNMKEASAADRTNQLASAYSEMEKLGGAHRIEDATYIGPDGEPRTLSAKDRVEYAVKRKLTEFEELERKLVDDGADPEEAKRRVLRARAAYFDGNGIADEDMRKRFNALNIQASIPRIVDGKASPYLAGVAEEYRRLVEVNPAYAERIVTDEKSAAFLNNYVDARADNMDAQEAMLHAAQLAGRTPTQKALGTPKPDDLKSSAESVVGDLDLDVDVTGHFLAAEVQDMIEEETQRGVPLDKAEERVGRKIKDRAFTVHGEVIVANDNMPADAAILFEDALADLQSRHGKEWGIDSAEDLFLAATPQPGTFVVMSKSRGNLPVATLLSTNDLPGLRKARAEADAKRTADLHAADAAKRKAARDEELSKLRVLEEQARFWERKAATGGSNVKRMAAERRRQYEERLRIFNTPPALPKTQQQQMKEFQSKERKVRKSGGFYSLD